MLIKYTSYIAWIYICIYMSTFSYNILKLSYRNVQNMSRLIRSIKFSNISMVIILNLNHLYMWVLESKRTFLAFIVPPISSDTICVTIHNISMNWLAWVCYFISFSLAKHREREREREGGKCGLWEPVRNCEAEKE